ncbi:MAG: histidine phosphatase family protein [Anaerolineaceae bacterium]|nr:histidine phosphatase family protein [Anaerolineaceae bacterium]
MKTILLVRHGTTEWVDRHILHGITDIPLNENGLRQAREVAEALKSIPASHLYTSPLTRCMQTSQAIAAQVNLQPVPMDGLKELDFGWLEGKPFRDLTSQNINPLVRYFDQYQHLFIRMISGESITHLRHRVLAAWQQILDENKGEISIVIGHSAVFNNILIHHFGKNFPKEMHYYSMRPCSIAEIEINDTDQARLVRMDDISHLSEYK